MLLITKEQWNWLKFGREKMVSCQGKGFKVFRVIHRVCLLAASNRVNIDELKE